MYKDTGRRRSRLVSPRDSYAVRTMSADSVKTMGTPGEPMSDDGITRRQFLAVAVVAAASRLPRFDDVTIVEFDNTGKRGALVHVPKVVKSDQRVDQTALADRVSDHPPPRHRAAVQRRVLGSARQGNLPVHLLRHRAVQLRREVRFRHGLAELLATDRRGERPARHAEQRIHRERSDVQPLRRAPRRSIQRRPEADGTSVLHRLRRAQVYAGSW